MAQARVTRPAGRGSSRRSSSCSAAWTTRDFSKWASAPSLITAPHPVLPDPDDARARLFGSKRDGGIDAAGPPRRPAGRRETDRKEDRGRGADGRYVERSLSRSQDRREQRSDRDREESAHRASDQNDDERLP